MNLNLSETPKTGFLASQPIYWLMQCPIPPPPPQSKGIVNRLLLVLIYLVVSIFLDEFTSETVCEGDQLQIRCSKTTRIAIFSAMFGRTATGDSKCPELLRNTSSLQTSTLTFNAPIATKVVCFSRLLKCLSSLYGKECGPRSDCSYRSSLFWVHAVCFYT